jgi:sugar phosphate permease
VFFRIFALTWVAYCGYYLCRKNFSVLMPFLKTEQGYSSEALAHVLFVYSVAYAAGQVLMGSLADRWGARLVVSTGAFVSAACSALTGTMFPLAIAQGVNGVAQASGWPGVLKMTRDWFPSTNRAVVMAWWGTHLVMGGFLATNLAAWATEGGWRRGAWIPSLVLVLVGATFGLLSRDKPGTSQRDSAVARVPLPINRALIAIAVMYFFVKMARYSFLFWLPLYMTEHLRYTPQHAGYSSSVFEVAGFGGALAAGYASERSARGSRFAVGTTMMGSLGLLCMLYPLFSSMGAWANLAGIALIGAFTFGPDTLMAGPATQECVPPVATARAGGFVNGIGSIGQVVSPYLVAGISSRFGWDAVFYTLGGMALLGSVALATQTQFATQWRKR